jgi:DNA-binding transcriptional MocR family regulator
MSRSVVPERRPNRAGTSEVLDLKSGNPDPRLLPPLRPALDAVGRDLSRVDNVESVLPALAEVFTTRFAADGVPARSLVACSGALDAMERVLVARLPPGARVLVEDPGYPPVYYLLAALGLRAVPVEVDQSGPVPAQVERVVGQARAFVLTPRAQNPTGAVLTRDRAATLREVLRPHVDLLVVEDDHAGDVAGPDVATLAEEGRRWAVIRSASKALGADLRFAVMAADLTTAAMVRGRQRRGPGWVSGVLQQLVLHQWTAPSSVESLRTAKAAYAERRQALVAALAAHGIPVSARSGLNVWVPVADEDTVVAAIRRSGYAVAAGRKFRRAAPPAVRITISTLAPGDAAPVADAVADAVGAVAGEGVEP